MNEKKAKQLRQSMKQSGIDPTEKAYHVINVSPFSPAGTIRLNGACGRFKYQQAKS